MSALSIPMPKAIVATTTPSALGHEALLDGVADLIAEARRGTPRPGSPRRARSRGQFLGRPLERHIDDGRAGQASGPASGRGARPGRSVSPAGGSRGVRGSDRWKLEATTSPGLDRERPGDRPGHLGRGGRCEPEDPADLEPLGQPGELEIFGPEVVAPFADAMGLVDRKERYVAAGQARHEPLARPGARARHRAV